jgi:hypothetical protein
VVPFAEFDGAAAAVERLFATGIDPSACELLERAALAAVARVEPLPAALAGAKRCSSSSSTATTRRRC